MKQDIILAGVGGQGILSIATVIGSAALQQGLFLKQAEVHGMSQRGGDVQSHLRLGMKPIYSDLIPMGGADLIISLEPMEALRYIPYLSSEGWIITNTTPFENIPNYPDKGAVMGELKAIPHTILIDADKIAADLKTPRSANMVLLGAAATILSGITPEGLREGIRRIFSRKGEQITDANLGAFNAGLEAAEKYVHQL